MKSSMLSLSWEIEKNLAAAKIPDNIDIRDEAFGIDPGINYGIAQVYRKFIYVAWGRLDVRTMKKPNHYMEAAEAAHRLMETIPYVEGNDLHPVALEGAAFRSKFGEANLAYVRAGFYLGLRSRGYFPELVPPMSDRLRVIGSGKAKGEELWPLLNANGADAAVLALYAAGFSFSSNFSKVAI